MVLCMLKAMDSKGAVKPPVRPCVYVALLVSPLVMHKAGFVKEKLQELRLMRLTGKGPGLGDAGVEGRRLQALLGQPEGVVFSQLVDATLTSHCTVRGCQMFSKAARKQASEILMQSRTAPGLGDAGIKTKKIKKAAANGEKLAYSILDMKDWQRKESTNLSDSTGLQRTAGLRRGGEEMSSSYGSRGRNRCFILVHAIDYDR